MKVFFIASARIEDIEMGKLIYDEIEGLGCRHTCRFMIDYDPATFYAADEIEWGKRYRDRLREIAQAEVCVFEASMHSLAIGQLVQEAISKEKPVIVLYQNGNKPQFMIGTAEADNRVLLLEYSFKNLREVLDYGFEVAKEMLNIRFTMLLPPDLVSYLNKVNREDGVSKSDFIRGLIRKRMENEE